MIREVEGKVVKGLGGLFDTRTVSPDGREEHFFTRAKGNLRRDDARVLVGDNVRLRIDDTTPDGIVISEVLKRQNALIRPPMANLDILFIVLAAEKPTPVLTTLDKLIAIAEYNSISPVVVVTKADLAEGDAERYAAIYRKAGFSVFVTSSLHNDGITALKSYIGDGVKDGVTAAFAGASGVGKSTLMNALFPTLSLATSAVSEKIGRGKHTTRHVELFSVGSTAHAGFLADTPGFSLLDFEHFDFFSLDDLPDTFREFRPYRGRCRYADCNHVGEGEDECAIARVVKEGKISPSRLASYRALYTVLKNKNPYSR